MERKIKRHFFIVLVALYATSCGQVGVRAVSRPSHVELARPKRIYVFDIESEKAKVYEYQGILRQQPASKDPLERRNEIVRASSSAIMIEIINGLRALGFSAERVKRGSTIGSSALVVEGSLLELDQGNPFRRLFIGFGSGASRITTRMKLSQGRKLRALLEFTTHADSGNLPGVIATLPAGAAIEGGLTAGVAVSSAFSTGVEAYRTDITQLAKASGEQAVRYLSEYFAEQGWIRPERVVKARIAY